MRNIILILLVSASLALTNIPLSSNNNAGSHLGQIEAVRILPDEIFFMLKDHSEFAYLNKIQGKLEMLVEVAQDEKVTEINQNYVALLEKGKMKSFDLFNKTLRIQRPFKHQKDFEFKEIVGYLHSPPLFSYILTDKNIVKIPFRQLTDKSMKIEYIYNKTTQKGATQNFKDLIRIVDTHRVSGNETIRKEEKYVLVSEIVGQENKQICLKLFQGNRSTQFSCFQVGKSVEYRMGQYRVGNFYISTSEMTYVVDEGLKVKNRINKKLVSLSKKVLVLEGGASFLSSKGSISEQLAFESQQGKVYKLLTKQDEISMVESSELQKKPIAVIRRQNKAKPINCWANQKQKTDQFELLIQWDDLSISFIYVSSADVKNVWRIEKAKQ